MNHYALNVALLSALVHFRLIFLLISCVLFSSYTVKSQRFEGRIINAENSEPLPYATLSIENSARGTISNSNGFYNINVRLTDTFIIVSYIGFNSKRVSISTLGQKTDIKLIPSEIALDHVIVQGDNNLYLDLISRLKSKLISSVAVESKAYLKIQTDNKENPIELIECYYNAKSNNTGIKQLKLKSGRSGIYKEKGKIYLSLNSSKLFEEFNIVKKNSFIPYNPFHLRRKELYKYYGVQFISLTTDSIAHLIFSPKKNIGNFFSTEIWVDLISEQVLKVHLSIDNASVSPIVPIWESDNIENLSMDILYEFTNNNEKCRLNYMHYSIEFNYVHEKLNESALSAPSYIKKIRTSGLVYLFDYNNLYILPFYNYDQNISDYHKIALVSLNKEFWNITNPIPKTKVEMQKLTYFGQKGLLLNYFTEDGQLQKNLDSISKTVPNVPWNKTRRVNFLFEDAIRPKLEHTWQLYSHQRLFNLEAQIYLDINKTATGIQYHTETVLDVIRTWYKLPKENYSYAFINIFFDLCEIKRRELETTIASGPLEINRIIKLYEKAKVDFAQQRKEYFKDVNRGQDYNKLLYWNEYVKDKIDIDNFQYFNMYR